MKSISLIRSFIYMLMSSGMVLLIGVGTTLALGNLMSKEELGLLLGGEAFVELFIFFFSAGFANSIFKSAAEDSEGFKQGLSKAVGNALLLKAMISIPAAIGIYFLTPIFTEDPRSIFVINAFLLMFVCDSFSSVFGIARRALHQFKLMSIVNTSNAVLQFIGTFVILKFFGGLELLVTILLLVRFLKLIISITTTIPLVKPCINKASIITMFKDSFHYGILDSLDGIENKIDRVMLSQISGPQAVALYSIPSKLNRAIITIPQNITNVFLPNLQDTAINNEAKFKITCLYLSRLLTVAGGFMFMFVYYCSQTIICKFFGNKYIDSLYIAQLFAFINFMWYLENIPELILMTKVRHYQRLSTKFLALGINIGLNLIMIPKLGLSGAVYATIIANIVNLILYLFFARDFLDLPKILLIAIFPISLAQYLPLYIIAPAFILYLLLIKGIQRNDLDIISKALNLRKQAITKG